MSERRIVSYGMMCLITYIAVSYSAIGTLVYYKSPPAATPAHRRLRIFVVAASPLVMMAIAATVFTIALFLLIDAGIGTRMADDVLTGAKYIFR